MQSYPFIFSKAYRYQRHLLFWLSWWIFQSILYAFTAGLSFVPDKERLPISTVEAFVYLLPHMFLAYSLMYFVVPKLLLKSKYLFTALTVILLFVATGALSAFIGVYLIDDIRDCVLPRSLNSGYRRPESLAFFLALLAGLRGGITVGGMAACIKLMKYWYLKEQRNMQLVQENTEAKLQLLKAQVHPHFLFNTLNNIYSYTQDTSPVASKLVMGLSDMLRCMLYECNKQYIPLNKEVKLLKDYIMLEKVRYGNKLDVSIDIDNEESNLPIAPLLLLPFVENCFKHGTSQMIDQPWLSLYIRTKNGEMHMRLMNGKAENYKAPSQSSGIGIENVRRRLELLYPEKHSLKITDEPEVFIVDLKVKLEENVTVRTVTPKQEKAAVYE